MFVCLSWSRVWCGHVNVCSWRRCSIQTDKSSLLRGEVAPQQVMPTFLCWISNEATPTFPIISKCSCLLKSIAFPLKNHLNLGFRDESLDTSHGRTRLWPVVTSKLRGGTVILVGSTLWKQEKRITLPFEALDPNCGCIKFQSAVKIESFPWHHCN